MLKHSETFGEALHETLHSGQSVTQQARTSTTVWKITLNDKPKQTVAPFIDRNTLNSKQVSLLRHVYNKDLFILQTFEAWKCIEMIPKQQISRHESLRKPSSWIRILQAPLPHSFTVLQRNNFIGSKLQIYVID